MPKIVKASEGAEPPILQFSKSELNTPAVGRNGALYEESDVPGSEEWSKDQKQIMLHLPTVLATSGLVELHIVAGQPWRAKRLVTLREVIFPDGDAEVKETPKKG